jgi:hypothetical protein
VLRGLKAHGLTESEKKIECKCVMVKVIRKAISLDKEDPVKGES